MSVNCSSPSNSALNASVYDCTTAAAGVLITTTFDVTRAVLLLPLSGFILYLGHQRWRQRRSMSHADVFTYHLAGMDLIWGVGALLLNCRYFTDGPVMTTVAVCLCSIAVLGGSILNLLTCVERYLAVVRPIIYLGLRGARGVRIRNISIGCTWLLCLVWMGVIGYYFPHLPLILTLCCMIMILVVVSFCSISVLCALTRPGPGDNGRDKERADQSKDRAFVTVVAIMGVLWLWFGGLLTSAVVRSSSLLSPSTLCVVALSDVWFNLPSSLVLPLLYLHRARKLSCCCYKRG